MNRRAFLKAVIAVPLAGAAPLGALGKPLLSGRGAFPFILAATPVVDEAFRRMYTTGKAQIVMKVVRDIRSPFELRFHADGQWPANVVREREIAGRPTLKLNADIWKGELDDSDG